MSATTKKFTPEIDGELYDEFVAVAERNRETKRHVLRRRSSSTCAMWFRPSTWCAAR